MREARLSAEDGRRIADGCDVSPHCLECPLAECKYVDRRYYLEWLKSRPSRAESTRQIAARLGKTVRYVTRRLQEGKELT